MTTGSALGGAVYDFAEILVYLVHNMSMFGMFADFWVNNILADLWLKCNSYVETSFKV